MMALWCSSICMMLFLRRQSMLLTATMSPEHINMGPTSHICPRCRKMSPSAALPRAITVTRVPTENSTIDRAKYEYDLQSHLPNVCTSSSSISCSRRQLTRCLNTGLLNRAAAILPNYMFWAFTLQVALGKQPHGLHLSRFVHN